MEVIIFILLLSFVFLLIDNIQSLEQQTIAL